jgi:hypothetical protein
VEHDIIDLTVREPRTTQDIVDEATEKATKLKEIVQRTQTFKVIGDKQHLQIEAWQTIGSFYGCTARSTVEPVEEHGVQGYKAHATVTKDATGHVLSEADGYCFVDEENWVDKDRFALASMAQTRAMSKALANKFKWVVVLAGYATTPVEEMSVSTVSSGPRIPFGDQKGKAPSELTVPQLCEEQARFEQLIGMPNNKFKDANERLLKAIKAELATRPPDTKGDAKLYEWIVDQMTQLKPTQKIQAIGIMNTHTVRDNPKLSPDQRTALIDLFNEKFSTPHETP